MASPFPFAAFPSFRFAYQPACAGNVDEVSWFLRTVTVCFSRSVAWYKVCAPELASELNASGCYRCIWLRTHLIRHYHATTLDSKAVKWHQKTTIMGERLGGSKVKWVLVATHLFSGASKIIAQYLVFENNSLGTQAGRISNSYPQVVHFSTKKKGQLLVQRPRSGRGLAFRRLDHPLFEWERVLFGVEQGRLFAIHERGFLALRRLSNSCRRGRGRTGTF